MDRETISKIMSELLMLCKSRPDLCPYAEKCLNDIYQQFTSAPPQIRQLIDEFLSSQNAKQKQVKPTSVDFREIARVLARQHNLDFDPKVTKKKEDLFQWFGAHWLVIQNDFFVLLADVLTRGQPADH
jgi:hypothetical protein